MGKDKREKGSRYNYYSSGKRGLGITLNTTVKATYAALEPIRRSIFILRFHL